MTQPFRIALALALFASGAGAQVVVTPSNSQGWGPDPIRAPFNGGQQGITGNQPRSGNGSLQMSIFNNGSQRTGYALFAPTGQNFGTLSSISSLGFDWYAQSPQIQSPTLRLYLNVANPAGGTMIGQFAWYADNVINGAVPANTWTTTNLTDGDGNNNFFLRFFSGGGNPGGQIGLTCVNSDRAPSFDDRMQSIAAWDAACDGSAGKVNLTGATVFGVGLDLGSFPGNGATQYIDYADNLTIGFNGALPTTYNFEVTSTPEPSSMLLFATGMIGLAGVGRRRRKQSAGA